MTQREIVHYCSKMKKYNICHSEVIHVTSHAALLLPSYSPISPLPTVYMYPCIKFLVRGAYITCPIGSISWSDMDFEPSSCGKISITQTFLSIFTFILLEFWSMTHSTLLLRSPEHWREQPDHADTSHLQQVLESGQELVSLNMSSKHEYFLTPAHIR